MITDISFLGLTISLYDIFYFGSLLFMLGFTLWYRKFYHIRPWRIAVYTVVGYVCGHGLLILISWLTHGFQVSGINYVRAVIVLPLPVYIAVLIGKDKFSDVLDCIAPSAALMHGVSHFGCIFAGCCHGFTSSWGLYNPGLNTILFPIQPIESISSLTLWLVLLLYAKKKAYRTGGTSYPLYMILFGFTRFIWEFFRDNPKDALGLSEFSYYAIAMFFVGILVWVFLNRRSKINLK